MNKFDLKLFLVNFSVVFLIFLIDRISKFYIIKLATLEKNFEDLCNIIFKFIFSLE